MTRILAALVLALAVAGCYHPVNNTRDPRDGYVHLGNGCDWQNSCWSQEEICKGPDLIVTHQDDVDNRDWSWTFRDALVCKR